MFRRCMYLQVIIKMFSGKENIKVNRFPFIEIFFLEVFAPVKVSNSHQLIYEFEFVCLQKTISEITVIVRHEN